MSSQMRFDVQVKYLFFISLIWEGGLDIDFFPLSNYVDRSGEECHGFYIELSRLREGNDPNLTFDLSP